MSEIITITSNVLLKSIQSKDNIILKLEELGINEKLFKKETGHPLRQDILMSLLHLLPIKFGVYLFELFDNDIVIEECFNSIDYFIDNEVGKEKILQHISKEKKDGRNFKLLFEKLFENIFKKEVHGLGSFTIKVLTNLTQSEIDIYWTELIRKNRNDVYQLLVKSNKNYFRNKTENCCPEQDLYISFLATTSSDKSIRSLATENLYLIAKLYQTEFINLAKQISSFSDINSIESVIAAMCGSVLSMKDENHTKNCLKFIEKDFLPYFKNSHVCIIDYIQTITEFALINFKIEFSDKILFNKENFKISIDKDTIASLNDGHFIFSPYLFGLDLYEFNKYQIANIASDDYHKRKTYSSLECFAIITDKIKGKGYNGTLFETIQKEFNEDLRYKYGKGTNDNLTVYQEKYLWQSYFELVGSLVFNKKLKSEDANRYRCNYIFFDPTFPRMPQKFQIINECFYPTSKSNVQEWINSEYQEYIDEFIIHKLYSDVDWILLSANISQKGARNNTDFYLSINSFLIDKTKVKKFRNEIENELFYYDESSFYHLFAGEINWSNIVKEPQQKYYTEMLDLREVMYKYSWSGWANNRSTNPYFKFLNPLITNLLGLVFNTNNLSFYNKDGNQVTKIIWTEGTELYYVKKETFEEIIDKIGLELVFFQFISKSGELGIDHADKTLSPSYKNLSRLIKYNNINKRRT